ncbi:hypothetical protein [Streptomyces sp. CA-179760]|uniref:hypothetical protein n=1 Tax=Streptomyces sp. CA-179760 TaxID=3240054 RepID=UPI003D91E66F
MGASQRDSTSPEHSCGTATLPTTTDWYETSGEASIMSCCSRLASARACSMESWISWQSYAPVGVASRAGEFESAV